MELSYNELKDEIFNLLNNKKTMVLSTSSNNRVTSRSMSCIVIDDKLYFQTDNKFLKYEQMMENPNVALCVNNIQIEGKVVFKGHPFKEENKKFNQKFKLKHRDSYDTYSNLKDEVVIEVHPTLITVWKYIDGKPIREYLNMINFTAIREEYSLQDRL